MDLSDEELERLYEGSKNDHFIVVGSEVRQLIGMIRRLRAKLAEQKAA
jgi:hypothetical protein